MTREEIRKRFDEITVWKRGDRRAPHKPLLLLLALARCHRGENRLLSYREADPALRELLEEFGPPRRSHHPEYPFWRLRNDGLWDLTNVSEVAHRASNTDAKKSALLAHDVQGGFPEPIYDQLRQDRSFLAELAHRILDAHFPPSMHADLLEAVGLDLEGGARRRRSRDAAFRTKVLRAYEYRCAVCGFDVRIDNRTVGLEAAHVKWHQAGGPDAEENGIALCTMHHKLLDRGAFRISGNYLMLVSQRVHGTQGIEEWLLRYHGSPVRRPQRHTYELKPEYVRWHVREVFKGPERPA